MNCCDEYGNCNQGRNCPVREKKICEWCHGLGYDASGQKCTCQPDHFGDKLAGILMAFIAVTVALMTVRSCMT